MGYKTPNIDRIAKEGALFTDAYAQQSCTAGRASFILGQHPFRTGLLTIGMPGSPQGIPDWAPTIADLLKEQGYATGQFGKNHLGDRDKHLPTVHGFDEFFGNLYHLNAEEEPETYYYPKDPEFRKKYGPRGVLHTWSRRQGRAEDRGHRAADPASGWRRSTRRSSPPSRSSSTTRRKDGKPFFVWFNTTRMHVWTHLKKAAEGRTGIGLYPDGMVEHDDMVGAVLKQLDDLGIADNTIVVYGTDNGAETGDLAGRRHHAVPRREGHDLGRRLPRADARALAGRDQAGHDRQRHLLAGRLAADAAGRGGRAGHRREAEEGLHRPTARPSRSTLDGYNFLPYFKGEVKKGPREEIFYFGQGGELNAIRWNDWKVHFAVAERQHRHRRPRGAGLAGDRQPAGRPLREGAARVRACTSAGTPTTSGSSCRCSRSSRRSSRRCRSIPFQQGSSLNAAGINYNSLKAMQAMKRLGELENFVRPPRN